MKIIYFVTKLQDNLNHIICKTTMQFSDNRVLKLSQSSCTTGCGSNVEFWIGSKITNSDEINQTKDFCKASFHLANKFKR
jgi:hypothetical protein